ncbi:hypothetical protein PGB28_19190 [Primorskyibacter aestuariivivens]|uniref:hypothetical protein n=1 Tax=Primorskyibacter aestuariivivens TaxID=1888912 RepID=UPI0022FFC4A3|nr:hypothetical protein [Primorskyibacter aestuariivivens]MDA7430593.1 hypothetical protein [Primorskyibacter aestuariivivens]
MSKQVFIHAGAHRTGTSSFQMCLDLNRDALRAAGVDPAYPGRDGIPGGRLRLKLPGPGTGEQARDAMAARAAEVLQGHSPEPNRALLLSEENIPGRMFHFYKGQIYPAAEARLKLLDKALKANGCDKVARLVLVLRRYDALFASAYRKRAEDNPVAPFREIAPRMVAMDRGWPALIRAIKTIIAPQEFIVLEYGQRGESRDVLRRLLPQVSVGWQEPERVMNLSATDAALEALQARYHSGETLGRNAWQEVVASHRDNPENTGFASFTEKEIRVLTERYDAHLDKIAKIRGITFIR